MDCGYFDAGRCTSCALMGQPYPDQLAAKQAHAEQLLAPFGVGAWHPPVASGERDYRNKAKMVVGGTVDAPTIGILDADGHGVDLQACGICSPGHRAAFPVLARFITLARIAPYDLAARRGELKHLIVTESPDGELMVRFVLRSTEPVARIRKHLPALLAELPQARVVTVNLLPEHKAVLEGDAELVLTEQETLPMRLNDVTMHLRPQSFFQTNTAIAAALYAEARDWIRELAPDSAWDLYSGVGGFALHLAGGGPGGAGSGGTGPEITGIETSVEAVASAELSRTDAALHRLRFAAGDATEFALAASSAPDLVVVNPPRRGIGAELAGWLEQSAGISHVLYSSCNAASLAKDLRAMPSYRPVRARVFDMFPQTSHFEVMVLLERR
ncbi:23S rRNA (uracil(747)-C(5))-methyltransferase RlmC [Agromyces mediolanus]|uniref:23S rRNA (Uracil(747)-C(5))-methyltransferase RlmC n=1 Tax=Agromyces mediolanus TaxID=41986 RepID=A0A918FEA0_AGRME|nr:23S rRNA (uracil(747)-C(5))-methyltransferase RlmC [Agromyces mediolanus]GGR28493.1 23S rRNA (uracil(747)-C(5))-methyltransferase RlmC [Agromyces mediolanus]GLJ72082.1 23S rRNA (uracil(747)-C(5))-methyltransferase RlmC [Agromyces mediolanus]